MPANPPLAETFAKDTGGYDAGKPTGGSERGKYTYIGSAAGQLKVLNTRSRKMNTKGAIKGAKANPVEEDEDLDEEKNRDLDGEEDEYLDDFKFPPFLFPKPSTPNHQHHTIKLLHPKAHAKYNLPPPPRLLLARLARPVADNHNVLPPVAPQP